MKREENRSIEIGILSVCEAIELLQTLPDRYSDWPIYCCGSGEAFLNINEDEGYLVFDEEQLFWDDDDLDLAELYNRYSHDGGKTFQQRWYGDVMPIPLETPLRI